MTDQEMKDFTKEQAVKLAAITLRNRASMMVEFADTLNRRAKDIEEFISSANNLATLQSDLMNWAINDVENLIRNLNFADLARMQVVLKLAEQP